LAHKVLPWKDWINSFAEGDILPLAEGIKKLANQIAGRADIRERYGNDVVDETEQGAWLKILRANFLQKCEEQLLGDDAIQPRLYRIIKHSFIEVLRKKRGKKKGEYTFVPLEDDGSSADSERQTRRYILDHLVDTHMSPQDGLEVTQLLTAIWEKLGPRQKLILDNYAAFKIGLLSGEEIASSLNVSIKTIEKEVAKIRELSRQIAAQSGYGRSRRAGNGKR
jgi:DNA-directed RNA polymerase specialized sigma24 family protein